MRAEKARYGLVAISMLLVACGSTSITHSGAAPDLPEKFRLEGPNGSLSGERLATTNPNWWEYYGSSELNGLMQKALIHNSDLRIARLQLAQAKIRAEQAKAGNLPTLTAPLRIASQGSGGTVNTVQSSQLGFQAVYRLDIWGEQSSSVQAAQFGAMRAQYERDNQQRLVVGNLAAAYIGYQVVSESLQTARENERIAKDILMTVEKRLQLGDATADEVEQQRSALALQQVSIASMENQQDDTKTSIARLAGVLPADLHLQEVGLNALSVPGAEVGAPATLLLRRPDIRVAEERMKAANANIEVARARLLPAVDLAAQAGYSGLAFANLLQPQNLFWNTVASLAVTIFDNGRREGETAFAQAYYEEMVETYRQIILQAVREVESALVSLRTANRRMEAQRRAQTAARNMSKIAKDAFEQGAIDLTAILEAQKNLQRSEDDWMRSKADVLRAYASLSLALGLVGTVQN